MKVDRFFFIFATMKDIKLTLVLFSFLVFSSCGKDDGPVKVCEPENPYYSQINIITGMDFFDFNGNPVGRWGFPNHKTGEAFVYPIPSTGVVSVSSQNKIKRIWLTPAECLKDSVTVDITMLSQSLNFEVSDIASIQVKDIPTPDFNNNINLNFEDVAIGMYRLFYQLDSDEIFWYNLYIDPSVNNIPNLDFMENGCD